MNWRRIDDRTAIGENGTIWRLLDGSTVVSDGGITVQRRGRDVLHYQEGDRYVDFTFEFGYEDAAVYTSEARTWQPKGEPFTPDERAIVQRNIREALLLHGVVADLGN